MENNDFYAIILAAGLSSRMGALKPLLPVGDVPAIYRTVNAALFAGVTPIVVTGHRAGEISGALDGLPAVIAYNPEYRSGMFTSVCTGLRALPDSALAFFMLPADCCAVRSETLSELMRAFHGEIIYPAHDGMRGHPPLIPIKYKEGLLAHNGSGGARGFLKNMPSSLLETADGGILLDMDTPSDYARLLSALGLPAYPPADEQYELLREYGTPENIIVHCEQVRELCVKIADSMKSAGFAVDTGTLSFAALVHDISRREDNHAERGALLLLERGFPAASVLVGGHMEPPPENASRELEILYMADKLLRRGRLTPPEETTAAMRISLASNPEALTNMEARMAACLRLLDDYASKYGIDVMAL